MAAMLENLSRRHFLVGGAAVAGGLVVGLRLLPHGAASSPPAAPAHGRSTPSSLADLPMKTSRRELLVQPQAGRTHDTSFSGRDLS